MNVAFIPVRGGSKSIPLKNIKEICGKPLVYWVVVAACKCKSIDKVYVATDSEKIKKIVQEFKIENVINSKLEVVDRSEESATDNASTEFAMLEFAKNYDFDNIVLIQATSPLLTERDLDRGFEKYNEQGTDSVLSVVKQKRFNWHIDKEGNAVAENYDIYNRPRRQEFDGYFTENGAFYITSRKRFLDTKNRISGNIKIVEMDDATFFEIDELSDWIIIENLMKKRGLDKVDFKIPEIKMFLTDCDGCLTDGGMYYSENGDELKKFNTKDGVAFRLLKEKGIITGIITSENTKLNEKRARKLNIDILEQGCKDKGAKIKEIAKKYNIQLENVLYIGDDIGDIGALKIVGMSCCPSDANEEIKLNVKYVAKRQGGNAVIREVYNKLVVWMREM